jgi:hypothetical protein
MDISGIFGGPRMPSVNDAIRGAATATGASFEYLLAAAQAESGLNPQAASMDSCCAQIQAPVVTGSPGKAGR